MNLLSIENLSKSYGEKILFENISFGLSKGEKVALIARNGSGKSSLMRILAGRDQPDKGMVTMRKDLKCAWLEQEPAFNENETVLETIFNKENPTVQLIRDYEECLEKNHVDSSELNQKNLQQISAKMDDAHAWDYEVRVRQVLTKLGITKLDIPVGLLSGGQKKRVALARVLLEPADLLFMDEPTNHLDVEMVEWLEDYLTRSTLTLLLVTHDRYFLDNICTRIMELDNGSVYSYEGNYTYFLEKKAERQFNVEREVDKSRNLLRTELEWMRRMPKARGTKSKARIDSFYELKQRAAGPKAEGKTELDIKMNRVGGKVLEMKKVYKQFGDLSILKGFDYTFKTGERIGIVGKNGSGKTTFLNLITGSEHADSGKINVGETIVFGYYSQQGLVWKDDKRVIEYAREFADVIQLSDGAKVSVSQFLTMFQFPPDMQHTFLSKLSGGERRRLHLLSVLIRNPNFLILDEPTNDLDLLTLGTLEEFLLHFKGCLLIVSHDRYFMDKLADHLFVFEGEGVIKDVNSSYSEYRIQQEEADRTEARQQSAQEKKIREENKTAGSVRKKLTFKEKMEFEKLEKEIYQLEEEKELLNEKLSTPNANHDDLVKWSERIEKLLRELDDKSLRWLELSELA